MRIIASIQGIYYLFTGIWPIVDINSFMAVTGSKTDIWLVKTVGVLVIAIGTTILTAAYTKNITLEIVILGTTACVGFILIDLFYFSQDIISAIYLMDAAAELGILIGWILTWKGLKYKNSGHEKN